MTEKQRRFVEAYMGEAVGNATEAARRAGYKGNDATLAQVGAENLRKPHIAAALAERQENDPLVADREERQRFLTRVMRGEQEVTIEKEDGTKATFLAPVDIKERLRACDMLAKAGGDYGPKGTEDDPQHQRVAVDVRVINAPSQATAEPESPPVGS